MTERGSGKEQDLISEIDRLAQAQDPAAIAERGLALCEEALSGVEREHDPDLWARLNHRLGSFALALGYDRSRLDLLERSTEATRGAQSVYTRESNRERWVKLQHNLALALSYLGELGGNLDIHRQAVSAFEEALAALDRQASPKDWASTANSLGSAHLRFGVACQDEAAVADAASQYQAALDVWKGLGAAEETAMTTYNLGLCHARRAELTGVADHYDRAIDCYRSFAAMMDRTGRPREWANAANAVAMALSDQGALAGEADLIRSAIAGFETILETMTRTDYPAWWAMVTINLCHAQLRLGELESDPGAFIAAAERASEAIEIATARDIPTYWTALTSTRANARLRLARRLGDASQLRRAADELSAVLAGGIRAPADQATAAHLRGEVHLLLAILADDEKLLAAALADFDLALSGRSHATAPVPWAQSLIGRGDARRRLGARNGDADLLAKAVADYGEVLDHVREGNPLPRAASARGRGEARLALWRLDRNGAIAAAAERDFAEAEQLLRPALDPVAAIDIRRGRASAALIAGQHALAVRLAGTLLDDATGLFAAETLAHEQHRLADALTGAGDIAAYVHALQGDVAAAIRDHDRGRAHRLRDRLRLSEAALDEPERLQIEAARRDLEQARRAVAAALEAGRPASVIQRLNAALDAAQTAFRTRVDQCGLTWAPQAPSRAELAMAAGDGAIVIPLVTLAGGMAIVLRSGEASVLALPACAESAVEDILSGSDGGWLGAYRRFRDGLAASTGAGDPAVLTAWNSAVEQTLARVWQLLMEPLDRHLQSLGLAHESEIVLIPGGRLAMLPLHAAGSGDARFLDRWSVTYAPSLTAHLACRRRVEARAANPPRLLAVTDPRGDLGASRNPASTFFPPAQTEAFAGSNARRSAVLAALPRCSHASFFTHARWDADHPERSHIELAGDDRIEARDFAELDLGRSRMVALGACESGVPGVRVAPDEFQGMPVSLIEAGVPGVLATLWPVFNRAAERVLERFFAAHIAEGLPPAVALSRAQRALRNRAEQGDDTAPTMVALGLRRQPAAAGKPVRQAYDLSQPMFWAAFAYNGA